MLNRKATFLNYQVFSCQNVIKLSEDRNYVVVRTYQMYKL